MKIKTHSSMFWIFVVSAATAVLALLSGYLQYRQKITETSTALSKEQQLNEVYKQLQEKSDKLIDSTSQILKLNEKLISADDRIIDLQNELKGYYTGGNSFSELKVIPLDQDKGQMILVHHGKYPLTNLTIHLVDLEIMEATVSRKGSRTFSEEELKTFSFDMDFSYLQIKNTLAVGTARSDYRSDKKSFNLFCTAANGLWFQAIRLCKMKDKWISGTIIYNQDQDVLYESIDKRLPKDQFSWEVSSAQFTGFFKPRVR